MRKTLDSQLKLGQIPIAEMKINPKDRDDIPAVLAWLRALYVDENVRAKILRSWKSAFVWKWITTGGVRAWTCGAFLFWA